MKSDVTVQCWTNKSINFKLEDLIEMFSESWDDAQEDGLSTEDWIQQILDEDGFDYLAECSFIEGIPRDEIGFEIEID